MIEMLGVLALVGVLSVGGIAGYSKAMWMYKTNKQAEQFGIILRALINNKEQFNIYSGGELANAMPLLKAMGEIPDEMIIPNDNTYIKDAFGLKYRIYHHFTNYLGMRLIIPASKDSVNACKNIYQLGKKFHQDIERVGISKVVNSKTVAYSRAWGDKYCTSDKKCLKDLAPHDIDSLCQVCNLDPYCRIYFILWHYD